MRICPVSNSSNWIPFFKSETNKIMTGDQRIGKGILNKFYCPDSGVVANKNSFSKEELEVLYGREYELNTLGKEEHFFYTPQGAIARSQVFFEWIEKFISEDFSTLIEIGCGEGNLLKRFSDKYPKKNILGMDGSYKAATLAKEKGLNVQQQLVIGNEDIPRSDIFLLVNVIEHIEDIPLLISQLKKSLNKNGRLIFCLPIQDYGGYDLFFAEHVWHFTAHHFEIILKRNGLKIIHSDINHLINHGIGLFVCEIADITQQFDFIPSKIIFNNLTYWVEKFKNLNEFLNVNKFKQIAIFGASEVSTLFLTFTNLGEQNIVACIDDTKKPGDKKHGIPIYSSDWLKENHVDLLLLAVNKKYHEMIKEKFKDLQLNIHPVY